MIELQFATESDIVSAGIRWFTWSNVSHVDFVTPEGKFLGSRLDGGVRVREPGYARFAYTERYRIDTPYEATIWSAAYSQIGKPYDWKGIVGFTFHRDWRDSSSWFCSEYVAWAFETGGDRLLNADHLDRIAPGTLTLSPRLFRI
jgi:uncharacterized protein YycO